MKGHKCCRAGLSSGACQVSHNGSLLKLGSDTKKVGKNISTKEVGYEKRLDITATYKHAEGEFTC